MIRQNISAYAEHIMAKAEEKVLKKTPENVIYDVAEILSENEALQSMVSGLTKQVADLKKQLSEIAIENAELSIDNHNLSETCEILAADRRECWEEIEELKRDKESWIRMWLEQKHLIAKLQNEIDERR